MASILRDIFTRAEDAGERAAKEAEKRRSRERKRRDIDRMLPHGASKAPERRAEPQGSDVGAPFFKPQQPFWGVRWRLRGARSATPRRAARYRIPSMPAFFIFFAAPCVHAPPCA